MTKINHISVTNFKGISGLDIDLGAITLVTGQNNAGKTSLLEAIELAFNPQFVTEYEGDVGKLINSRGDRAEISIDYIQDTQTSILDFSEESQSPSQIEQRTISIREPKPNEASKILVDAVLDIITSGNRGSYIVNRFSSTRLQLKEDNELGEELFEDAIRDALSEFPQKKLVDWADGNCIIITINGDEYPYIYLGDDYDSLRDETISVATELVQSRIDNSQESLFEHENDQNSIPRYFPRIFNDLMVPRFGRGRFIANEPATVDEIRFVDDSIQLSSDNVNLEKENAAVRLSNIEDYVKENKLVANLDTLSLDQLVFSEDGEKYQVPYEFMGDGFKAMIGVLWELSNSQLQDNILLLEEAETHMHPAYINQLVYRLIELALMKNIQIIVTTHNIDLIRSFFADMNDTDIDEYLSTGFTLVKMDPELPEIYNFRDAQKHASELELDLRGL